MKFVLHNHRSYCIIDFTRELTSGWQYSLGDCEAKYSHNPRGVGSWSIRTATASQQITYLSKRYEILAINNTPIKEFKRHYPEYFI